MLIQSVVVVLFSEERVESAVTVQGEFLEELLVSMTLVQDILLAFSHMIF